jgi:adenylosuccinate lyase
MPHKMNTRSSERICGFLKLLKMYNMEASLNAGQQWEEGDVECSVVRRIVLSDMFYTADGICETALTVLNGMGAYDGTCRSEVQRYKPFLATTTILLDAERAGISRSDAYDAIRQVATAESKRMRDEGSFENRMIPLLAEHPVFKSAGYGVEQMTALLSDSKKFVGSAQQQIEKVAERAKPLLIKYENEAKYEPRPIL